MAKERTLVVVGTTTNKICNCIVPLGTANLSDYTVNVNVIIYLFACNFACFDILEKTVRE